MGQNSHLRAATSTRIGGTARLVARGRSSAASTSGSRSTRCCSTRSASEPRASRRPSRPPGKSTTFALSMQATCSPVVRQFHPKTADYHGREGTPSNPSATTDQTPSRALDPAVIAPPGTRAEATARRRAPRPSRTPQRRGRHDGHGATEPAGGSSRTGCVR